MINSFPPIISADAKMLILGTMPGRKSLDETQYYAHKHNAFWKIIFTFFTELPVSEVYETRLSILIQNQVAVWDILQNCERLGSLDSNIRNPVVNDIPSLLKAYPKIKKVIFNGKESQKFYLQKFKFIDGIEFLQMPSTSPANTVKFEEKLKSWLLSLR